MTDAELNVKITAIFAGVIALVVIGYFAVFILLPLFVLGVVVDQVMRVRYKGKVKEAEARGGLISTPVIYNFETQAHDGQILIAWMLDLPMQAYMDIYRLVGQTSGDLAEIQSRGTCIHTTGLELTNSKDDLFTDYDAPDGVLYYVPVLYGQRLEKRILDYGFFSFYGRAQYTTRRKSVVLVGHASRVVYEPNTTPLALPDDRDEATKMADEILTSIKARKEMGTQLDAAIDRIRASGDLTDAEKAEAIELLETRSVLQ